LNNENLRHKALCVLEIHFMLMDGFFDDLGILFEHRKSLVPVGQFIDNVFPSVLIHPDINAVDHAGQAFLLQAFQGIHKAPVIVQEVGNVVKGPLDPHFHYADFQGHFLVIERVFYPLGEVFLEAL